MNDLTEEWVVKAESDYRVAMCESQATKQHRADAVFSQQNTLSKY